ncbi:helix-turn-helix domain-containing protein [Caballeronia sordidicola]|nr:AraC family transcriptional regulator [Caballeronia sordidicola]
MNDDLSPSYAPASILSGNANPNTWLADSQKASWHSVYLRHDRSDGASGEFETFPTPDQKIVVVLKGKCELAAFDGRRWQIAQRRTGSTGMTPGGETGRLRWLSGGSDRSFECGHLYLPQPFILEAADHYRRSGNASQDAPLTSLAFDDPALAAMVGAMIRAMDAGAPNLYAETAAQWIAVHLLAQKTPWRQRITDGRRAGDLSDARLARVIDFMQSNFSRPLSLDELAGEAAISKFHFGRLFRRRTGETPLGYLTRLRLEAACRLLVSTDLPIEHVAAACGYSQPSNFNAAFRRWYGRTPTQTRLSRD